MSYTVANRQNDQGSTSTLSENNLPEPFEYLSVDQSSGILQLGESHHEEATPYHARVQLVRMQSSTQNAGDASSSQNHGSADSGFQEIEIGFSLYVKRRRKE